MLTGVSSCEAFEAQKTILIRRLVRTRLEGAQMGEYSGLLDQLTDDELYGLPEATIVTIASLYKQQRHQGSTHSDALRFIDSTRSPNPPSSTPGWSELPLSEYIFSRIFLEMEKTSQPWYHEVDFIPFAVEETNKWMKQCFGY